MGVSTHITGFISAENDLYKKHARVLRACIDAGIEVLPKETAEYFGSEYPEEYLFEEKLEIYMPVHDWTDECCDGCEIFVNEIPEGVHKIRISRCV
jgi:hypothetical protein